MTAARARLLLYLSMAGWGVTFVANHELLAVLDPFQIVVLRFLGVGGLFVVFFAVLPSRRPRLVRRDWGWLLLAGFLAVPAAQVAGVAGQQFLPPSMSGLVAASSPAIAAALAYRLLDERLAPRQVAGIAVALAGAAMVIVYASGTGTELTVRNPAGASLLLLSQVFWCLYTVLARTLAVRHDPLTMVGTAFLIGTVMLLPGVPHALAGVDGMAGAHWLWLGHLVVGGTLLPHVSWFVALRHLTANETAVSMYLVPLWAAVFSVLVLHERLTVIGLVGGVGILVGITLAQRRRVPGTPPLQDPVVVEPAA